MSYKIKFKHTSHVHTNILCSHMHVAWLIKAGRGKHKAQSNLQGRNQKREEKR